MGFLDSFKQSFNNADNEASNRASTSNYSNVIEETGSTNEKNTFYKSLNDDILKNKHKAMKNGYNYSYENCEIIEKILQKRGYKCINDEFVK